MTTYRPKIGALLSLFGITFALLLSGWWLVQPAYAATEHQIVCPANGIGSVDMLKAAIRAADSTPELDSIVINVTGADCVFTLVAKDPNTTSMGLQVLRYDLIIRAVGGRAIIERSPNAPAFSILRSAADLTLENLTLRNGLAPSDPSGVTASGGAINGEALTLTNVLLTNNESENGGAVYVAGPLVMDHVTASHNRTRSSNQASGGAIVAFGTLTATNITVTHNVAANPGFGGGIYVYGNAAISSALFASNRTDEKSGGGLIVYGDLMLANSNFMSNTAGEDGGGVYVYGNLTLSKSEFTGNSTRNNGGGLYVTGDLTLFSNVFTSNSSGANGGGVYVGGSPSVSDTRFIGNNAGVAGGGLAEGSQVMVSLQTKMATIEASTFISNQAQYGAGAQIQSGLVQNNLFEQNIASGSGPYHGGGALMAAWHTTIQNNRFIGNLAPLGGAVHLMFFPPGAPGTGSQIANNLLIDNDASQGNGGAIAIGVNLDVFQGSYVEIKHNTVAHKSRGISSAIYVARSTADITNNIITQHRIGIHAIGISTLSDANLIHGNTINYAGIEGGPKDLIADPLFVDAANQDYHLQPGSPARDSGLDLQVMTDLDGLSRPQGKGYDRGAFELVNHAPLAQSDAYTTAVDSTLGITAPGLLVNDNDSDGDAITATVATTPAHGDLALQSTGAFIYTPTAGFTGTDSFTYQATDGSAASPAITVTLTVTAEPAPEPVAISGLSMTHDEPVTAGRSVSFVASVEAGSDPHFAWDFGDGATVEGATASHTYAQPGEYTVTLNAGNNLGDEQVTTTVTVLPVATVQHLIFTPFIVK